LNLPFRVATILQGEKLMKNAMVVLAGSFLFLVSQLSHADLKSRFQEELLSTGSVACPSKVCPSQKLLESYQYILIDGFLSENTQKNFLPAVKVFQTQWNISDFTVLRPSSYKSIPENAEIVYNTLMNLRATSPHKKAIIIAHSKGATETFLALLHHPELIKEKGVTDFITVDGCIAGTPLADIWTYFCKDPPKFQLSEMNAEMEQQRNYFCEYAKKWDSPLRSMKPNIVKPLIASALAGTSREDLSAYTNHFWTIEGAWPKISEEWKTFFIFPHLYLQYMYGDNDGVIPTANQRFPEGFGHSMGVFPTDHGGLTNIADTPQKELAREAFIRAVFREVLSNQSESTLN
jgi:hypothetical protein